MLSKDDATHVSIRGTCFAKALPRAVQPTRVGSNPQSRIARIHLSAIKHNILNPFDKIELLKNQLEEVVKQGSNYRGQEKATRPIH